MLANQQFPILNGVAPSYADIKILFSPGLIGPAIEAVDIQSLSSSTNVEVGVQRGISGGRVLNRTLGQQDSEASMVMYRAGWTKLYTALVLAAPRRGRQVLISPVQFDIHVIWTPIGSIEIFQYKIKGCRVIGRVNNHAEGTDADTVEVPLSVIEIVDLDMFGNEISLL